MTDRLSYRQRETLNKASDDWADLPSGMGCTNATLEALERRGIVETRIETAKRNNVCGGWQWRLKPNGIGAAQQEAPRG
jgi:hypothetical protein